MSLGYLAGRHRNWTMDDTAPDVGDEGGSQDVRVAGLGAGVEQRRQVQVGVSSLCAR